PLPRLLLVGVYSQTEALAESPFSARSGHRTTVGHSLPTSLRDLAMMNRRRFATALAASATAALTPRLARGQSGPVARNIVLVHGLFADGSCWSEVIARLQAARLNVTAVQNPLTTLPEAVASAQRVLARPGGPTVLVGHSVSGMIVTT